LYDTNNGVEYFIYDMNNGFLYPLPMGTDLGLPPAGGSWGGFNDADQVFSIGESHPAVFDLLNPI